MKVIGVWKYNCASTLLMVYLLETPDNRAICFMSRPDSSLPSDNQQKDSLAKKIVFAFIPLLLLLLMAELGLRWVYFQKHSVDTFALVEVFRSAKQHRVTRQLKDAREKAVNKVEQAKKELGVPKRLLNKVLFSPEGEELATEFKKRYEKNFKLLVAETDKIKSKLAMLYIPMGVYKKPVRTRTRNICQKFYSDLARKYNIDFIDVTPTFLEYPEDLVTLIPDDKHLSRFGNKLVVRELSKYFDKYDSYRADFKFRKRPAVFGDIQAGFNIVWNNMEIPPSRALINAQGLRMGYDITFPKKKQRILALGDSYTFGNGLPNHHTYPYLLGTKYPDKEFINAGVSGYTIIDEASLFAERAKYVEPDITLLQVVDNDISDLFYFSRNLCGRKGNIFKPSKLETDFINKVKKH